VAGSLGGANSKPRSRATLYLASSAAIILLCTLLYAAALATDIGLGGRAALLRLAVALVAEVAVAVAAAWASRGADSSALRRGWLLCSLAAWTAALGFLVESVGWRDAAGALLLLHYLFYFAGLLLCAPGRRKDLSGVELLLDVALAILIVGLGLNYLVWHPELRSFDGMLVWFYVLGDALLLSVLFGMPARAPQPLARLPIAALTAGFGLVMLADLCRASALHAGALACPDWAPAVWLLGQGCIVWAGIASLQVRLLRESAAARLAKWERGLNIASLLLRLGIVLGASALLASNLNWLALRASSNRLLAGALLLLAVLAARYGVLRWKNQRLGRELQAAAGRLQQRVDERTRELAERVDEVQQLRAEAEHRAAQQAALNSISALVNSSLHVDGVLDSVVEQAARLFQADDAMLYLYDPKLEGFQLRAHHTSLMHAEELARWQHLSEAQSPASIELLRKGRPLLLPIPGSSYRMPPALAGLGATSALLLPLLAQERLLGLVILGSQRPGSFNERHAELATAMGQQLGSALENARLYRELCTNMDELQRAQMDLLRSQRLEALAQTVAGAAHELNNPLTVVQGYSELLLRQDISPQMRGDVERILQAIERSRQVVSALLAFGQREVVQRRTLDINQVLERTLSLCQFDLEAAQIRVERRMEPNLPLVCGDAALLRQVFFNIIVNARQAMSESHRGGRLTVRSFVQDGKLRVEISDDGPGIAPEIMDKIFDPFFTTRSPGQGMGLGLSLCFGIIAQHGGRIWAASPAIQQYADGAGPGTTLVVELPQATANELAQD